LKKVLDLSIIIPVLNEANGIEALLSHLLKNLQNPDSCEIIIVDGGSTDQTPQLVQGFCETHPSKNIRTINSAKGRAVQMNVGAKASSSDLLYFLHADSFPPKHFDQFIKQQVALGNPAGCFRLQFDSNHWWLRIAGWFTKYNWKACRGGDQSLFINKVLFDSFGGYNEAYKIYEDNVLICDLYKAGHFVVIPEAITTSARLYRKKGIGRLQFHFWVIHFKKKFGASPESLYKYYQKNISGVS